MLEIMGCNQSSQPITLSNDVPNYTEKWATHTNTHINGFARNGEIDEPPPEFREPPPYQGVLDGLLPNMTKGSNGVEIMSNGSVTDSKVLFALLEEYKECEDRIRAYEREDPLILYYVKQLRLRNIKETIKRHEEMTETLEQRVKDELEKRARESPDGEDSSSSPKEDDLRKAIKEAVDPSKLSKAEQDMIAKKNQLEIATTETEMLFQEKALLESDIQELKMICAKLTQDYKRQEDISMKLSVSAPGQSEMQLLNELASIETRRIKVSEVYERWKEARVQLADSCRSFASALHKWKEIKDESLDSQFNIAEEARDELITALQFLANARFFIQHEFPYCTKQEIGILNKALTYIFVDMRSEERRKHAENCYAAFHNRAVALYAWIDTTVKAIIEPVVIQTSEDLKNVMDELQELRFQSIKVQFPNVTWRNSENRPIKRSGSTSSNEMLSDEVSIGLLKQLDLSQLAPLPRTIDLFGKQSEDIVEGYKTTLRESMSGENEVSLALENNLDNLVEKKIGSLKEKHLANGEKVRIGMA